MPGGHGIAPTVYHPSLPPINPGLYNWMFSQSQAPEPGTLILAAGGLLIVSAGCRERRAKVRR
jgi:hypothetical protein